MTRLITAAILLVTVIAGCASSPAPIETPSSPAAITPSPRAVTPSPAPPSAVPSHAEPLVDPGQPFDAAAILDAMRASRRPDGVPEALQDEGIARAVADAIWTVDGRPWRTISIGGSCGPQRCTLEVAGAGPDAAGDDAWAFAVEPATGAVELVAADLHALPASRVEELDAMARRADRSGLLDGLVLGSARWLPPPDRDRFALSYRTGDEEGSCARDVILDAGRGELVDTTSTGC